MTRKKRTILFFSLAILFFILAPLIVFYSLGWRFDWQTKMVTQPGIFYFKVSPKSSQIYINSKLKKKTDFFFGSALIENLLPRKYEVEVKKDGFHSWKKSLEIKKRQVTEVKNIQLLPDNPTFNVIARNVTNIFPSLDQEKIAFLETNNEKDWSLKLLELPKGIKSHLIKSVNISKEESELLDLRFSLDTKKLLLKVGTEKEINYYLLEIDRSPAKLISLRFLGQDITDIYFSKQNIFLLKNNNLSRIDMASKKTSPVAQNVASAAFEGENIYCLKNDGFLYKTTPSSNQEEKLNTDAFLLKPENKYELITFSSSLLLKENNSVYILREKEFEKLASSIKDLKFSQDQKKLAWSSNSEIKVLFLDAIYDSPQREKGDILFLARFSEDITDVFWYTDHYLIFATGNKIKVAEIDDRDRINIVDFTEFQNPNIFWSQKNKILYVLAEQLLYISELAR